MIFWRGEGRGRARGQNWIQDPDRIRFHIGKSCLSLFSSSVQNKQSFLVKGIRVGEPDVLLPNQVFLRSSDILSRLTGTLHFIAQMSKQVLPAQMSGLWQLLQFHPPCLANFCKIRIVSGLIE